jgi:hypothetical protein
MTHTLEAIRRLLLSHGFEVGDDTAKVPPGGLVARRGTTSVVVYAVDGKPLPDSGATLRVQLTPAEQRPSKTQIATNPEVPGLRRRLIVEI